MTNIAICADAQSDIGMGHLRRMLTLAEALLSHQSVNVTILTSKLGKQVAVTQNIPQLRTEAGQINPHEVRKHLSQADFDMVVLDNYFWNDQSETKLRPFVKNICVVDDLADRNHDADVLLDQNAHHSSEHYSGLVQNTCNLLIGSQYCLLSSNFRSTDVREHLPPDLHSNAPIFVSLGGGDPNNSLLRLTTLLLKHTPFALTVATGSHISDAIHLKKLEHENDDRLEVILDSKTVKSQMMKSKFAVAAGGTMTWERAIVGLPSLCLVVADNQVESSTWLKDNNIHDVFDMRRSDWSETSFLEMLTRFTASPKRLQIFRDNSRKLIDGNGAFRAAKALIDHILKQT